MAIYGRGEMVCSNYRMLHYKKIYPLDRSQGQLFLLTDKQILDIIKM